MPLKRRLSVFQTPELVSQVNPFVNKTTEPSWYEKCKLILMAPVAVIRITSGILTILSLAVSCKLITLGLSDKDLKDEPLSPIRRSLLSIAIKIGGRSFLFAMGFHWITVRGKMATTEEAPIVVSNHTCMIDPFILGQMYCSSAVGAQEHLDTPIMGKYNLSFNPNTSCYWHVLTIHSLYLFNFSLTCIVIFFIVLFLFVIG